MRELRPFVAPTASAQDRARFHEACLRVASLIRQAQRDPPAGTGSCAGALDNSNHSRLGAAPKHAADHPPQE
jgi:hypothetical protein